MPRFVIHPRPPYDFELSLDFMMLRNGRGPFPERRVGNAVFRGFRISGRVVPVEMVFGGSVDEPRLEVSVPPISPREEARLRGLISRWLNLDEDLSELYRFMDSDARLRRIKERLYGLRVPRMGVTVYETVVKCIAQQQISLEAAFKIISRLVERFGDVVEFAGEECYEFPQPSRLAHASIEELRRCGLSRRKAEYIAGFSREVAGGNFDPEEAVNWSEERVSEEFGRFRGIGEWTVEMIKVAGLGVGMPPAQDLGIRRAVSKYYFDGSLQSEETVRRFMERWRRVRYLPVYLLYAYRMGLEV